MSLFDMTGQIAVITGSSRGIGRATAFAMADQGAKVVISSRKLDACIATASLRRIGEPDEIAGGVVFLASKAGAFTTGQTIVIDGGVTSSGGGAG